MCLCVHPVYVFHTCLKIDCTCGNSTSYHCIVVFKSSNNVLHGFIPVSHVHIFEFVLTVDYKMTESSPKQKALLGPTSGRVLRDRLTHSLFGCFNRLF